jgi:RNA polymerase sigma-70 factor (ECF subfamily)
LDDERFRDLYEQTAGRLRGYLRRVSGSAALADDILQETFLRVFRMHPQEGQSIDNAGFLFKVATNLLYDHWRREKRERGFLGLWKGGAARTNAALEHDVGRLLLLLKPRERALLWLAYVEGCSHEEIARVLELRVLSVRVLLFRARTRMAALLAQAGFGGEALR